ncbi:hypothetical protein JRQ81_010876 [Phrynocephalus forsythii]|uniref:UPAR/Ly6 domain-containing protein n=1 Tax=Phrynocephalus forsythii TaxID=171643 RepID=A0A9Q1B5F0_9SAUR|nr:hypothetical protein JRQ81_010876 [Phrynocephalus forsythii]
MTPLLIFLLAGCFFIQPTNSLKCYTCNTQLNNDKCKTEKTCEEGSRACKTDVIALAGLFNIISKDCASQCDLSLKDFAVGKRNISCCYSDLCNTSGTHAFGVNLFHVALAVLTSIACLFLGNGL